MTLLPSEMKNAHPCYICGNKPIKYAVKILDPITRSLRLVYVCKKCIFCESDEEIRKKVAVLRDQFPVNFNPSVSYEISKDIDHLKSLKTEHEVEDK